MRQMSYPIVRLQKLIDDQESAREATWLAAYEASGMTQTELARQVGLSQSQVSRRLARARQARGPDPAELTSSPATTTPTPGPSELPRLELTDTETRGTTRPRKPDGLAYSLASDAISLDGGQTWLPPDDPSTPRMPVLVSSRNGPGNRKQFLEPRPYQAPPEPPGPTSHKRTPGLKGGRGS